jgi:putative flavoprotein involved in K+ transport
MPDETIETLVIGGGQAGLVMSHRLKQRGLSHLVLERHRIAERWRSERWDGLKFQFPNWSVRLPDFPFPHSDPDAFAATSDIIKFIEAYAGFVAPPIRCGVAVTRLSRRDGAGFIAETTDGTITADNVVVATGPYQRNLVPDLLGDHPVFQVHAADYRNPGQLPPGAVLVAGAGASGAQIAEELLQAGRRVYLSVGRHRRLPRRYRGRDLIWWLAEMRLDQVTPEERGPRSFRGPMAAAPSISAASPPTA